jgi:hypothetical protein
MKKNLFSLLMLLSVAGAARAQFSPGNQIINVNFNRGASPANDTTANGGSNVFYESPNNASSAGRFFPNITDGSYRLRALCYGNGQFKLAGNVLTMQNTTTSTALAKFANYNISGSAAVVKFKFTLDLTGFTGDNGNALIFAFGNNAGNTVMTSSSIPFTTANAGVFGSFRIIKSGNVVTQFRTADGSTQTNTAKRLIMPSTSQTIEIFANRTTSPVPYRYRTTDTADSTLAANTYNVYVNGEKHVENFPKVGTLYTQTTINALSIVLAAANGGIAETVKISDLEITYPVVPLPVTLLSFTGKKEVNGIRLDWKTASELNNSHFEISRSTDGQLFNILTSVNGKGTSTKVNNYSYLDNSPLSGTNYYKLKQFDIDGKASNSDIIVAVENSLTESQVFTLNVDENVLKASFYASSNGIVNIKIHDLSGRIVLNKSFSVQEGSNNVNIASTPFNSGIYVATLIENGKSKSIKFTK